MIRMVLALVVAVIVPCPGALAGEDDAGHASLAAIDAAIARDPQAWRFRQRAALLDRLGRPEEALSARETSLALAPGDIDAILDVAYAYRALGRNGEAAALFGRALTLAPARPGVVEDLAWSLKDAGEREAAADRFRDVLANAPLYPQAQPADRLALEAKLWNARSQIALLERDGYVTGYMTLRAGAGFGSPLSDSGDGASGAGIEGGWILAVEGASGARPLTAFARAFGGFERDTLVWRDDSLQGGAGLRWAPFAGIWATLSAERLVALGDDARDDWLFTAVWSEGGGLGLEPLDTCWFSWNVYASASYATGEGGNDAFTLLQSEAIAGWSMKVSERVVVMPHAVAEFRHLDEHARRSTLLAAGPGVLVRWWFDERTDSAPRASADLKLQYRFVLAGDAGKDGALLAGLTFSL